MHRTQALTLNNVTIHADKMTAPGQLGVALGRAKSKEGVRLLGYSNRLAISAHPAEIEDFYLATDELSCSCLDSLQTAFLSKSSQETLSACESETPSVLPTSDEVVIPQNENETNKEICIVCSTTSELDTVCCDGYETWCHFECVGLTPETAEKNGKWYCPICVIKV